MEEYVYLRYGPPFRFTYSAPYIFKSSIRRCPRVDSKRRFNFLSQTISFSLSPLLPRNARPRYANYSTFSQTQMSPQHLIRPLNLLHASLEFLRITRFHIRLNAAERHCHVEIVSPILEQGELILNKTLIFQTLSNYLSMLPAQLAMVVS